MKRDIADVESHEVEIYERFINDSDMDYSKRIVTMIDKCVKEGGNMGVSLFNLFIVFLRGAISKQMSKRVRNMRRKLIQIAGKSCIKLGYQV